MAEQRNSGEKGSERIEVTGLDKAMQESLDIEILEEISHGAWGVVYLGRQIFLDRMVAVKVSRAPFAEGEEEKRADFEREAKLLASLSHPGIVSCLHAGVADSGHYYLVMEFIDGPTMKRYVQDGGPQSEESSLMIVRRLALALEFALDENVIHCNLKPQNVLLSPHHSENSSPELPFEPKLSDLGLASHYPVDPIEQDPPTEPVIESLLVMSPEQFESDGKVDFRSDMYALGCILYYMLSGRMPFDSTDPNALWKAKKEGEYQRIREAVPNVSKETEQLIDRLLSPNQGDRPRSYVALLAGLERNIADPDTEQLPEDIDPVEDNEPEDVVSAPAGTGKGNKAKVLIAVVIAVILAGGGIGVALMMKSKPDQVTASTLPALPDPDPIAEQFNEAETVEASEAASQTPVAPAVDPDETEIITEPVAEPEEEVAVEEPVTVAASESPTPVEEALDTESMQPPSEPEAKTAEDESVAEQQEEEFAALFGAEQESPSPTPRVTWKPMEFENLMASLDSLMSPVIYFRDPRNPSSRHFETTCLLDEGILDELEANERIFVNVPSGGAFELKEKLKVETIPCLVVYRDPQTIHVFEVNKNSNVTELGLFLLSAGL